MQPGFLYIGRGSVKFGLPASKWRNPFVIGQHGDRHDVIRMFREHLLGNPDLLEQLVELKGQSLLCHCGPRDLCHADVLIRTYVDQSEPDGASDGPTSDEDEFGSPKLHAGAGWHGVGSPLPVGRGSRRRGLQDGGGLCSPGRWAPVDRRYPEAGKLYLNALGKIISEVESERGEGYWRRLACAMACSQVAADPFDGIEARVKAAFVEILSRERDFRRDGVANHQAASIDFELIGAVGAHLQDPDTAVMATYRVGVPLGWRGRLPRTPAVFERKTHWAPHVGHEGESCEWTGNYKSATEHPDIIRDNFEDQVNAGMMVKTTYSEARAEFGGRLRVASLGALEQKAGEFRIVHDGTHGVRVNASIRVRDQEACPTAHDLVSALDHEISRHECVPGDETGRSRCSLFMLALDISKAHRRVPVRRADWGLQACSDLRFGQLPGPGDHVWLNTVGTYGIGCASYWWGRLGALLHRLVLYIVGPAGLLWALRFADDYIWITGGTALWRPLILAILFLRALDVPLKWTKFRGGRRTEWIGYFFDLEDCVAGLSDGRSRWAASWCRKIAESRAVLGDEFREGLGRLGFAATLLLYTKPFLGPLYSWAAAVPAGATADVPPMVKWILIWLAEAFEARVRISFGRPVGHLGERFRADAKAEGDLIVVGGWELAGHEGTAGARWFSLRLTRQDIPWAYVRGDPFRSVSALELLATTLCIMVFDPREKSTTGAQIALTASGDNQSNGFSLDRLCSTKFPLYLVLMELSEQLRTRHVALSVVWRPRDENEEADALTNERFGGFRPELRIPVRWEALQFLVLPRLTDAATRHFEALHAIKKAARQRSPPRREALRRRVRLREREPW